MADETPRSTTFERTDDGAITGYAVVFGYTDGSEIALVAPSVIEAEVAARDLLGAKEISRTPIQRVVIREYA